MPFPDYYPTYPYDPYGGYFPLPPAPDPYPSPGPFPPEPPAPNPDDNRGPDDYRIGEQDTKVDPLAEKAVQEIRTAWLDSDIELLSKHIRRDIEIEVYVDHKLDKTLDASDFLSDTRYAFDTKTIRFEIESITPITRRIYKVAARRTTSNAKGDEQTTAIRYILEKMDGVYIITRIEADD